MSQIGNVDKTYGQQVNIGAADVAGSVLLNSVNLPKNAIIVSSPIDEDGNDIGTYTLIATDTDGNPVRLTYTIQSGNGLNIEGDVVKLSVDDETIIDNDGKLSVNSDNIIDNSTIISRNNVMYVDTSKLTKADSENYGIVIPDNSTIKSNDGVLSVNTQSLELSDSSLNQLGVVRGDQETTVIENGYISVLTEGLDKATSTTYGIVRPDNYSLTAYNGELIFNEEVIPHATQYTKGTVKVDNKTIVSKNGILSVNTNNIVKATKYTPGTVKIDGTSITSYNGYIGINNYENIVSTLNTQKTRIPVINYKINNLKQKLEDVNTNAADQIYSLEFENTTATALVIPKYNEEIINMPEQKVYVVLDVITSNDFKISVNYINNEIPAVELAQVNYNGEKIYDGTTGLDKTYKSTDMTQKRLTLLFTAKNFKSLTNKSKSKITKITINCTSVSDATIYKEVHYSIIRYNSIYDFTKDEQYEDLEASSLEFNNGEDDSSEYSTQKLWTNESFMIYVPSVNYESTNLEFSQIEGTKYYKFVVTNTEDNSSEDLTNVNYECSTLGSDTSHFYNKFTIKKIDDTITSEYNYEFDTLTDLYPELLTVYNDTKLFDSALYGLFLNTTSGLILAGIYYITSSNQQINFNVKWLDDSDKISVLQQQNSKYSMLELLSDDSTNSIVAGRLSSYEGLDPSITTVNFIYYTIEKETISNGYILKYDFEPNLYGANYDGKDKIFGPWSISSNEIYINTERFYEGQNVNSLNNIYAGLNVYMKYKDAYDYGEYDETKYDNENKAVLIVSFNDSKSSSYDVIGENMYFDISSIFSFDIISRWCNQSLQDITANMIFSKYKYSSEDKKFNKNEDNSSFTSRLSLTKTILNNTSNKSWKYGNDYDYNISFTTANVNTANIIGEDYDGKDLTEKLYIDAELQLIFNYGDYNIVYTVNNYKFKITNITFEPISKSPELETLSIFYNSTIPSLTDTINYEYQSLSTISTGSINNNKAFRILDEDGMNSYFTTYAQYPNHIPSILSYTLINYPQYPWTINDTSSDLLTYTYSTVFSRSSDLPSLTHIPDPIPIEINYTSTSKYKFSGTYLTVNDIYYLNSDSHQSINETSKDNGFIRKIPIIDKPSIALTLSNNTWSTITSATISYTDQTNCLSEEFYGFNNSTISTYNLFKSYIVENLSLITYNIAGETSINPNTSSISKTTDSFKVNVTYSNTIYKDNDTYTLNSNAKYMLKYSVCNTDSITTVNNSNFNTWNNSDGNISNLHLTNILATYLIDTTEQANYSTYELTYLYEVVPSLTISFTGKQNINTITSEDGTSTQEIYYNWTEVEGINNNEIITIVDSSNKIIGALTKDQNIINYSNKSTNLTNNYKVYNTYNHISKLQWPANTFSQPIIVEGSINYSWSLDTVYADSIKVVDNKYIELSNISIYANEEKTILLKFEGDEVNNFDINVSTTDSNVTITQGVNDYSNKVKTLTVKATKYISGTVTITFTTESPTSPKSCKLDITVNKQKTSDATIKQNSSITFGDYSYSDTTYNGTSYNPDINVTISPAANTTTYVLYPRYMAKTLAEKHTNICTYFKNWQLVPTTETFTSSDLTDSILLCDYSNGNLNTSQIINISDNTYYSSSNWSSTTIENSIGYFADSVATRATALSTGEVSQNTIINEIINKCNEKTSISMQEGDILYYWSESEDGEPSNVKCFRATLISPEPVISSGSITGLKYACSLENTTTYIYGVTTKFIDIVKVDSVNTYNWYGIKSNTDTWTSSSSTVKNIINSSVTLDHIQKIGTYTSSTPIDVSTYEYVFTLQDYDWDLNSIPSNLNYIPSCLVLVSSSSGAKSSASFVIDDEIEEETESSPIVKYYNGFSIVSLSSNILLKDNSIKYSISKDGQPIVTSTKYIYPIYIEGNNGDIYTVTFSNECIQNVSIYSYDEPLIKFKNYAVGTPYKDIQITVQGSSSGTLKYREFNKSGSNTATSLSLPRQNSSDSNYINRYEIWLDYGNNIESNHIFKLFINDPRSEYTNKNTTLVTDITTNSNSIDYLSANITSRYLDYQKWYIYWLKSGISINDYITNPDVNDYVLDKVSKNSNFTYIIGTTYIDWYSTNESTNTVYTCTNSVISSNSNTKMNISYDHVKYNTQWVFIYDNLIDNTYHSSIKYFFNSTPDSLDYYITYNNIGFNNTYYNIKSNFNSTNKDYDVIYTYGTYITDKVYYGKDIKNLWTNDYDKFTWNETTIYSTDSSTTYSVNIPALDTLRTSSSYIYTITYLSKADDITRKQYPIIECLQPVKLVSETQFTTDNIEKSGTILFSETITDPKDGIYTYWLKPIRIDHNNNTYISLTYLSKVKQDAYTYTYVNKIDDICSYDKYGFAYFTNIYDGNNKTNTIEKALSSPKYKCNLMEINIDKRNNRLLDQEIDVTKDTSLSRCHLSFTYWLIKNPRVYSVYLSDDDITNIKSGSTTNIVNTFKKELSDLFTIWDEQDKTTILEPVNGNMKKSVFTNTDSKNYYMYNEKSISANIDILNWHQNNTNVLLVYKVLNSILYNIKNNNFEDAGILNISTTSTASSLSSACYAEVTFKAVFEDTPVSYDSQEWTNKYKLTDVYKEFYVYDNTDSNVPDICKYNVSIKIDIKPLTNTVLNITSINSSKLLKEKLCFTGSFRDYGYYEEGNDQSTDVFINSQYELPELCSYIMEPNSFAHSHSTTTYTITVITNTFNIVVLPKKPTLLSSTSNKSTSSTNTTTYYFKTNMLSEDVLKSCLLEEGIDIVSNEDEYKDNDIMYRFEGWYLDKGYTAQMTSYEEPINNDMTCYSKYTTYYYHTDDSNWHTDLVADKEQITFGETVTGSLVKDQNGNSKVVISGFSTNGE